MNIDDVLGRAKEAVNVAAKKTEEVVNVSKLKMECSKISSEIKSVHEKLGSSIYHMRKEQYENEDLLNSLCEELDELYAKEAALKAEIAHLQNVKVCPVCSYKNVKESFYCARCGGKLNENDAGTSEAADFSAEQETQQQEYEGGKAPENTESADTGNEES